MLIPPGFEKHATVTPLGTIAYYSAKYEFYGASDTAPTLVFLHGLGGGSSAYEWSRVYPAFASRYRVLAPDLIGWGRSDRPERRYTAEDYTNCILEFLGNTCDTPAIVLASSISGGFAVRAAINKPEMFKSLILTNPTGLSDFGEDYNNTFLAQIVKTPIVDRILYSTAIANPTGIATFLEQRQFANPNRIDAEIVEAYLNSAQQPNAECSALSFVGGDACFDLAAFLPQLTTPTAILWGKEAQFVSEAVGKRLAALNPTAIREFRVLEDVGLTPQLELPAVTIGIISAWLEGICA